MGGWFVIPPWVTVSYIEATRIGCEFVVLTRWCAIHLWCPDCRLTVSIREGIKEEFNVHRYRWSQL